MKDKKNLSTVERRRIIVEDINENKQVDVSKLTEKFGVSEVTIRKDLRHLEAKNILIRSRGGAMLSTRIGEDLSVNERLVMQLDLKKKIAKSASTLINNGDVIIMDSGTTLMQLAKNLENIENLTVITNALDIVSILSEYDHIKIIVPGGIFRKKSFSLVGENAVENIKMFRADKYFVSADGISEDGLFTSNLEEGQIAKIIMSNAKKNIVLMDSSKFNKTGIVNFAPLSVIHTLIVDDKIPKEHVTYFRSLGLNVMF